MSSKPQDFDSESRKLSPSIHFPLKSKSNRIFKKEAIKETTDKEPVKEVIKNAK